MRKHLLAKCDSQHWGGNGKWIFEFEASLVSRVSSEIARATLRNPVCGRRGLRIKVYATPSTGLHLELLCMSSDKHSGWNTHRRKEWFLELSTPEGVEMCQWGRGQQRWILCVAFATYPSLSSEKGLPGSFGSVDEKLLAQFLGTSNLPQLACPSQYS
jgi:hypothetical protein